ncbi:arginine decarboxylase, partial [Acinetobacter baumannii]
TLSPKNFREVYHDAFADKETLQTLYDLGLVSLRDRALAEEIFYHIARRVYAIVRELPYAPDEFEDLEKLLADKLVCNFSIFQSLPDAWAI